MQGNRHRIQACIVYKIHSKDAGLIWEGVLTACLVSLFHMPHGLTSHSMGPVKQYMPLQEKNTKKHAFFSISFPRDVGTLPLRESSRTGPYFLHDPWRSHRLRGILMTQLENATNRAWWSLSSWREMTLLSSSLSALHLLRKIMGSHYFTTVVLWAELTLKKF